MAGRISYVPFSGTLTAANGDYDLVLLRPGANKPISIMGFMVGQISEVGDAQDEQLDIRILRLAATVTNGTGGAVGVPFSPRSTEEAVAVGYTSRTMDTAVATTTGTTREWAMPQNVRGGAPEWFPFEPARPTGIQNEALILRLSTAVADDVSIKGWVCVEEEG
jgi:hypothetical protein